MIKVYPKRRHQICWRSETISHSIDPVTRQCVSMTSRRLSSTVTSDGDNKGTQFDTDHALVYLGAWCDAPPPWRDNTNMWFSAFHDFRKKWANLPLPLHVQKQKVFRFQDQSAHWFLLVSVQFSSVYWFHAALPQLHDRMTEQICRQWKKTKRHQSALTIALKLGLEKQ